MEPMELRGPLLGEPADPRRVYEIAVVGGGLSGSVVLLGLARALLQKPRPETVTVLWIDAHADFGCGVVYGERSGTHSLLINELGRFLPAGQIELLLADIALQLADAQARALAGQTLDALDARLVANAQALLESPAEVYAPRQLVGRWLRRHVTDAISDAAGKGRLDVLELQAEVTQIGRAGNVLTLQAGGSAWKADRIVLAMGHTPYQDHPPILAAGGRVLLPYNPSLPDAVNAVHLLAATGRVGILGSSAAALDLVHNLVGDPRFVRSLPQLTMISTSGALPGLIAPRSRRVDCAAPALDELVLQEQFSADDLLDAALADVEAARSHGADAQSVYDVVMPRVNRLLPRMPSGELRRYVDDLGMVLSRELRRTGPKSIALAERLQQEGRLTLIAADIRELQVDPLGVRVRLGTGCGPAAELSFDCVVDCRHGRLLSESPDPLLRQLLAEPTLKVRLNSSGRGLAVDDSFQADRDLFVVGPLLNGTVNASENLWHAERASTLWRIAEAVAGHLVGPGVQSEGEG
jgi:uncharacterized NAD(P)/FAD-binding protein YdhS